MSTTELETRTGTATGKLRLSPSSAGLRMSPEEFDAIERFDRRYRYELIEGVLVVKGVPRETQAGPNEWLGYWLGRYKHDHPQGSALDETLPERYILLPNSRRLADRVVWAGLGRLPDPPNDMPTIAVEFVSAGKRNWLRDYVTKRDEYMAAGIVEYWIIDRFRRTMTVHRASDAGPTERVLSESETFTTDLLPGFELPLGKLLAEADKWARK